MWRKLRVSHEIITNRLNKFILHTGIIVLLLVAVNAYTVAQFDHGAIIDFAKYNVLQHAVLLLLISVVFLYVYKNPEYAVNILMYLSVLTGGMYIYRFAILDELILAVVLLAILLARKRPESKPCGIHVYVFLYHLLAMSVIGLLAYSEIRALRYVLIFSLLITLLWVDRKYKIQTNEGDSLDSNLVVLTLVYEFAYLINSAIITYHRPLETILGIGEAGAGYQGLLFLFTLPSCFAIYGAHPSFKYRLMALLSVIGALLIAAVGDSRYVFLTIIIAMVFSLKKIGLKGLFKLFLLMFMVVGVVGVMLYDNPLMALTLIGDTFEQQIGGSRVINYYGTTIETASGDQGRMMLVLNGFYYYLNNPMFLLTGVGTYGYVHEAYGYYQGLLSYFGIIDNIVNYSAFGTPPRPPSFGSYIVDYGMLGLTLFAILWVGLVKKIVNAKMIKVEALSYPLNLLLFMSVGEQLDSVSTYILLLPIGSFFLYKRFLLESKACR